LSRFRRVAEILEGFLSELTRQDIKINKILESEGNKDSPDDKQNRVDLLAETEPGELLLMLEKIEPVGTHIEDSLLTGSIMSATEDIRGLCNSFEDQAWEVYLTNLLKCKTILAWLRQLGAKKALKFVSYQTIMITLPSGNKIQVRSPFFVKAAPKKGRKKKGPNYLLD